jgi:Domain found in Dishevelled, Egl-10, and Pleckstrin (DEP)
MIAPLFFAMPHAGAEQSARSMAVALGLAPMSIVDVNNAIPSLVQNLKTWPSTAAIIDLSSLPNAFTHVLHLAQQIPPALRGRVILLRHDQGPVLELDAHWIEGLGFAGFFSEIYSQCNPSQVTQLLAKLTQTQWPSSPELHTRLADINSRSKTQTSRGLICEYSKMEAENLFIALRGAVESSDLKYRFKTYHACFTGRAAVSWLRKKFACSQSVAVQMGQALLDLGMLHHVVFEHDFVDDNFFYRFDEPNGIAGVSLSHLLAEITQANALSVKDRRYLGAMYAQCWVGNEAIDWLCNRYQTKRHSAESVLNRLMGYGLIEHVHRAHPVKDDHLFYRFRTSTGATTQAPLVAAMA